MLPVCNRLRELSMDMSLVFTLKKEDVLFETETIRRIEFLNLEVRKVKSPQFRTEIF